MTTLKWLQHMHITTNPSKAQLRAPSLTFNNSQTQSITQNMPLQGSRLQLNACILRPFFVPMRLKFVGVCTGAATKLPNSLRLCAAFTVAYEKHLTAAHRSFISSAQWTLYTDSYHVFPQLLTLQI